ncbi:nucleoside 2-deoxyribosyltransferase [Pseudohongiella sp.]|uniref:Nucleoside 2-deoxyribosyltransferase n=1 Tax=marine sediment metagenome TaxID=412755 RepID=A0A0F9YH51_9ZZZZ|nr:nucleoside 2-deoxyribosyltransferase [Pseudohongiella sp.]HDZ09178.1 nucleoside 2-deoxyribosyltransferase [Pseudohongiella sp.]
MKVYLASPLFSIIERELNTSLCTILETSFTVYLPQRDGPLIELDRDSTDSIHTLKDMAFRSDIDALRSCDVMVAVLDGRALDEGVCIEMGFAKALGKRIIGVKTDIRVALPWGNNPMVDGCVDVWVADPLTITEVIHRFVSQ